MEPEEFIKLVEECRAYLKKTPLDQVSHRMAELIRFERQSRATLKVMNILSTNEDFAVTADLPKLEWAFGRKLS